MTSVTDKLEIRINSGKPLIFTAANLTAENKKMLANWGMIVETTNAQATTYSLVLPPPPPPVPGMRANKSKQKRPHPLLPPPPPPPSALQHQSAKITTNQNALKNNPDTVAKSKFADMLKQVAQTVRYPKSSREKDISGMVVATFRINQDKKISDVKIKKGVSPELDAETIRSISAFNRTLPIKPGTYSMGIDFNIDYADGTKTQKPITIEKVTAGIITTFGYENENK
jgi:TonB family protein